MSQNKQFRFNIFTVKNITYVFQALLLSVVVLLFKIMPLNMASDLSSLITRMIGKRTSFHEKARKNILIAYPNLPFAKQEMVLLEMWDNLGRSIAELPHILNMKDSEYNSITNIFGIENLKYLKNGGLIFAAHYGNWEIVPRFFTRLPIKFNIVYRRANNPFIDKIIQHFRKVDNVTFLPKGKYGAKNIIDAIKRKEVVIMLVDQRLRDGIAVPFFNINAMTPPAIASLALKYQLPISSIYCQRVKNKQGDKFNIHVNKPINIKLTGQKDQDIYNIMSYINKQIELWINEQPGQWFWIHDRWSAVKTHI